MRRNGLPYRLRNKRIKRKKGRRSGLISLSSLNSHSAAPQDSSSLALAATKFLCDIKLPHRLPRNRFGIGSSKLGSEGLETIHPRPAMSGPTKSEGRGSRFVSLRDGYCPNPNSIAGAKEFPEGAKRPRMLLIEF